MTGAAGDDVFKRALKLLAYRSRSEAELGQKLARAGFPSEEIEAALEKLRRLKLVDDEAFARSFARGTIENRGYGPLRVERELRLKGVAKPLIGRVLEEAFGRGHGKERAKALLERRFRGKDLDDFKNARRAIAFLKRRGYRDSVIAEILRQPVED